MELIINANREGYATDQIRRTLTVGELIEALRNYDDDTPVFIGNDRRGDDWYTYGGIFWDDIVEHESVAE